MKIDREKCTGCGKCFPYCPVEAILWHKKDKRGGGPGPYAEILRDECVECSVCFKARVCPTDAIASEDLEWPRVLRRAFSDPFHEHKGTNVPGRGTEEMKTNEMTGRFRDGTIGIGLEFGRPGVGVRLGETEEALKRFVRMGLRLEPLNPLTQLVGNPMTGELRKDVVNEKVLSAIVEFIAPVEKTSEIFEAIKEIGGKTDTVFSLDLISKVAPDGTIPALREAEKAGVRCSVNGKVNVGLGRPLFQG